MADHCYVNSMAQVSCQQPLSDEWFDSPCMYTDNYVRAIEPSVREIISPAEARRMSRILKRTVCTSVIALEQSDVPEPDAIITGTGMGCIENSEKFLTDLSTFGENCLKPTLFMQSTHNTISSLMAIRLKCHGYNNTYSHRGISFESALMDAWLQMKGGLIRNALVGAHDEVTPLLAKVLAYTRPDYNLISESSVSVVLTDSESSRNLCEVTHVRLFHDPGPAELAQALDPETGRVLILGVNGNLANDAPYENVLKDLAYRPYTIQYKNVFGDNFSASALAFYAGVRILENQRIPDFLSWRNDTEYTGKPEYITILNHSDDTAWSLIRLKRAESCGN